MKPRAKVDSEFQELFERQTEESKEFMKNTRLYNNLLAMASIKFQEVRQKTGWNPNLKVNGEIHEFHGPLQPDDGQKPNFAQVVIHDIDLTDEQMLESQ